MSKISLKKAPTITTGAKIAYGAGEMGYSVIVTTISGFMMFFGTVVCSVSGSLMGLAISLATVWDALTDPVMGYLSDRHNSKLMGRRHGFILAAIFGMSIVNVMIWSVPIDASSGVKFIWFLMCMILINTFNTFYATPNSALGVELSGDYYERISIQSVKSVFFLIGSLLPTVTMAVLQSGEGARYLPESYRTMSYIASSIMLICGTICFLGSYSQIPRLKAKAAKDNVKKRSFKSIFSNFFLTLKVPIYRNLILGYSVTMMSSVFLTSAGLHVLTYTFKLESMSMYLLMAGLFLMTILSQPLWIFLVKKFDKRFSILAGMGTTLAGILYLGVIFVMRNNFSAAAMPYVILPALFAAGAGMGAIYALPTSMIGDAAAAEKAKTHEEKTGTYTGFMTLANKIGQAAASLFVGVMLDVIGFQEGAKEQTASVEWGLGWIVITGLVLTLIGGMILYSRYNLKKSDIPDTDEVLVETVAREKIANKSRIVIGDDDNDDL
ncbi:MAG: MFS transporter [Christensenellales bacterium]